MNILLKALNDKNPHVRKRAILSLEKIDASGVIKHLSILATTNNDRYVRRRAILALAKFKEPQAAEALIYSLKDEFPPNRKAAAIALGKTKEVKAVEPLIALLEDNIREIRIEAVEALGETKDPRAIKPLKKVALHDKDSLIRDLASDALKKITGKEFGRYRRAFLRLWGTL